MRTRDDFDYVAGGRCSSAIFSHRKSPKILSQISGIFLVNRSGMNKEKGILGLFLIIFKNIMLSVYAKPEFGIPFINVPYNYFQTIVGAYFLHNYLW
jgi:hypothetical protein